ncbi:citrate/2-methylcitrate synthase [Fodinibius sp.]|uniref:citrate/2-methylcitrate synthase n=1 Tax=Fodinibius sp. TaxID=1872440 RepID=UPI002ACE9E3E|nr:citrate/2-methylcitrate synthase [Fodinibius sp.]MDZ7659767.1 citrate/2-methylcitrate synthase [Fodinibius sp.]
MAESKNTEIDLSQYPHINKGLAGIVAFSSNKSFIDGEKGELIYAGYDIDTLAENASFEEVCFLLWNDHLPNQEELNELNSKLQNNRELPGPVLTYIKNTSKNAEPMAVLRTAVSMLGDFHEVQTENDKVFRLNQAISITAKIPTIIAAFDRARNDKNIVAPLDKKSTAYNFLYMLNDEEPGEKAEQTMDLCLILHAEHGMNASTFTNRAICSTESDMYSSVTGAIGALKGPLHGGANQQVMNMLMDIDDKDADPVKYVQGRLERKEKIMGFGHRVYKTMDPRARILRGMSKELSEETGHENLYKWSEAILKTMKDEKDIDPNVDFFSATVYYSMGIKPDLFTCIFAMSRVSGWTGHYIEQAENNKLVRPRALYVGEKNKEWVPVENR